MIDQQVLYLIVPPSLKDELVDQLIKCDVISGFNIDQIEGYSREHSQYDRRELVEGFRHLFRFEILHQVKHQAEILSILQPICQPAHLRYWLVPIERTTHF